MSRPLANDDLEASSARSNRLYQQRRWPFPLVCLCLAFWLFGSATLRRTVPSTQASWRSTPSPLQRHISGLAYLRANAGDTVKHPIETLIDRAKREWDKKLARQSRTLEAAVAEYKRRNARSPPRGFDKWCVCT